MSLGRVTLSIALAFLLPGAAAPAAGATQAQPPGTGRQAADLDGAWEIAMDKGAKSCRVLLRAQPSDNGDYFLGMPPACRHAMPDIGRIGRWTMPDAAHLTLHEPTGVAVLKLAAEGESFAGKQSGHDYVLKRVPESGRSAVALQRVDGAAAPDVPVTPAAKRTKAAEIAAQPDDLAGRYAVMRDKRDTGCMLTLDKTKIKGGTRAHLAPGCRDQGIVIFDPAAWQIIKGELVLTARAGHKTHLLSSGEGAWAKNPKDGGKPLGLKKL